MKFEDIFLKAMSASLVPKKLPPESFWIEIVENYREAIMTIELAETEGNKLVLAVMAHRKEDGSVIFEGSDTNGKTYVLDKVKKPAILYMMDGAVSILRKYPKLWKRVKGPKELMKKY